MFRYYSKGKNRCAIVAQQKGDKLVFAASRCSDKDPFNRKIGRAIAEGRLQTGRIIAEVPCEKDSLVKTFVNTAKLLAVKLVEDMTIVHKHVSV